MVDVECLLQGSAEHDDALLPHSALPLTEKPPNSRKICNGHYEQTTTTYLSVHDEGFVGVSEVTTARVADASIGLNVEELQWVLGRLEHDGAVVLHTHAKLAVRPALALQHPTSVEAMSSLVQG